MEEAETTRAVLYRIALKRLSFLLATCPYGMIAGRLTKLQVAQQCWHELVHLHEPDKDYQLIIRIIDTIVHYHPHLPWLRVFRAHALLPLGYYSLAIEDCQYALAYFYDYPEAHTLLAEIYYVTQRYAEALEATYTALDMDPCMSRALFIRSIIYEHLALHYPDKLHRYGMLSLYDRERLSTLSTGKSFCFDITSYRLKNVLNEK